MNMTLISAVLAFVLGVVFTVISLTLPEASIGIVHAPKVFPVALGILMTVLSLVLMAKEGIKIRKEGKTEGSARNPYLGKIFLTCLFAVLYALLFDRVGYVISTVLFLEAELWLFNGGENWKINTLVAVVFSLFIYIVFSKLLGVYLPMTPGLWI